MTDFASKLRAARRERAVSQGELAKMIGLDPAAISHFERGQRMPSLENLRKIAVVLDVSADRLLGLKPPAAEWFAGLTGRDKAVVLALVDVLRKSNAQAGRTDIRKGKVK